MGLAAAIGATLLAGFLEGRAQKQAYQEQARQQEQQAQLAYQNAEKLQKQAEQQAQNNAINEENKRRRMLQLQGQNVVAVGKSGVTMSGSALTAMADSAHNQETELAIDRYNGRQKVDNIFQSSTDNVNQGNIYKSNAAAYRKAGSRAMMNSMLKAVVSSVAMGVGGGSSQAGSAGGSKDSVWTYSKNADYKGDYGVNMGSYKDFDVKQTWSYQTALRDKNMNMNFKY